MSEMTTVTRGSQITLTKEVREKVGIAEGDKVMLNVIGNTIVVAKRDPSVFGNIEPFLPANFENVLKMFRTDSRKRLERLGIIPPGTGKEKSVPKEGES
ncbi:AbrB/MazE/SpoVT family DNA-binding domain-containing protein [Candidatus Woesearchaeota archaeon]|nr:AbrB/MazE/SpoVT family DNA-binding domain-containing protein [Candidatus Woesearchaeota archaeon]